MQEENANTEQEDKIIAEKALMQARQMEDCHKKVKKMFPTNYMQKMQPYINAVIGYKKKMKIKSNVEAALELCSTEGVSESMQLMFMATAVQMTLTDGK